MDRELNGPFRQLGSAVVTAAAALWPFGPPSRSFTFMRAFTMLFMITRRTASVIIVLFLFTMRTSLTILVFSGRVSRMRWRPPATHQSVDESENKKQIRFKVHQRIHESFGFFFVFLQLTLHSTNDFDVSADRTRNSFFGPCLATNACSVFSFSVTYSTLKENDHLKKSLSRFYINISFACNWEIY